MKLILLALVAVQLFTALVSAQRRNHGVATIMQFANATSTDLTKRFNRGTWYSGQDLLNAACYDRNGLPPFSATIYDMIGAMAMNDFEDCYKCLRIRNNKDKKLTVNVMIVDKCAACEVGKAIDLTPAAFKKLAPNGDLDIGVLDISWETIPCSEVKNHPLLPKNLL